MSVLNCLFLFFLLGNILVFISSSFCIIFLAYTSIFKYINYVHFVSIMCVSKRIILKLIFIYCFCCCSVIVSHLSPLFLPLLLYPRNPFCRIFFFPLNISNPFILLWSPCFLFFILTVSLQLILNVILVHVVPILFNIFNASKPCTIKCLLFHRANISKNLFGNFFHNKKFSHQFVLIISIT